MAGKGDVPRLSPLTSIPTYFRQLNFVALSELINAQPSHSFSLTSLLRAIASNVITEAYTKNLDVDALVTFYGDVAAGINPDLGDTIMIDNKLRRNIPIRVANNNSGDLVKGSELLAVHLSIALWDVLHRLTSRRVNSDGELDDRPPSPSYFSKVFVLSILLARAFALLPTFQSYLWPVIEEWAVRGIFSGATQAPADLIVAITVIYGAGNHLREFLGEEKKGRGKVSSVRTLERDDRWGWHDIVFALRDSDALLTGNEDYIGMLSWEVRYVFSSLGEYVGDDKQVMPAKDIQVAGEEELVLVIL